MTVTKDSLQIGQMLVLLENVSALPAGGNNQPIQLYAGTGLEYEGTYEEDWGLYKVGPLYAKGNKQVVISDHWLVKMQLYEETLK